MSPNSSRKRNAASSHRKRMLFGGKHINVINGIIGSKIERGRKPTSTTRRRSASVSSSQPPKCERNQGTTIREEGRLRYEDDYVPQYKEFEECEMKDFDSTDRASTPPPRDEASPCSPPSTLLALSKSSHATTSPCRSLGYNDVHRPMMGIPYSDETIPILFSDTIEHSSSTELPEYLTWESYAYALEILQRGIHARDLGLTCSNVPFGLDSAQRRTGPCIIIDNVDLYLSDYIVYVAAKDCLIDVPSYFDLVGIPSTQKARFNGRIPPWAKAIFANAERRYVTEPYFGADPRQLFLRAGSTVDVYDTQVAGDDIWALGKLTDGDKVGWFPLNVTAPPRSNTKSEWLNDRQDSELRSGEMSASGDNASWEYVMNAFASTDSITSSMLGSGGSKHVLDSNEIDSEVEPGSIETTKIAIDASKPLENRNGGSVDDAASENDDETDDGANAEELHKIVESGQAQVFETAPGSREKSELVVHTEEAISVEDQVDWDDGEL